jgi:hypothetical protein
MDKALFIATFKEELEKEKAALAFLGVTVDQFMKEIEASILDIKIKQVLKKI